MGGGRELLARQTFDCGAKPWIVWTGGDAESLARQVCGDNARIIPDLVLQGLVRRGFDRRVSGRKPWRGVHFWSRPSSSLNSWCRESVEIGIFFQLSEQLGFREMPLK